MLGVDSLGYVINLMHNLLIPLIFSWLEELIPSEKYKNASASVNIHCIRRPALLNVETSQGKYAIEGNYSDSKSELLFFGRF